MRINDDGGDLLPISQTKMLPRATTIGGFVDTIASREIGTPQTFPAAHVNDFRIRRRNSKRSHRTCGLIVEDRAPGASVIGGLPHSAVVRGHVENVGLSWDTANRNPAPAPKGSDQSPVQFLKQFGIKVLGETECDEREYD